MKLAKEENNLKEPSLEEALERASLSENRQSIQSFLQLFLKSRIFLPRAPLNLLAAPGVKTFGAGFLATKVDDEAGERLVVPGFSSLDLLESWVTGLEIPDPETRVDTPQYLSYAVPAFLHLLDDDMWLHLNPGAEHGKEFSPWEISLLRKAEEGIEEVVAELCSGEWSDEITLLGTQTLSPELKRRLEIIFSAYKQVREAYYLDVGLAEGPVVLVGLRLSSVSAPEHEKEREKESNEKEPEKEPNVTESERLELLCIEIKELVSRFLPIGREVLIVNNIDAPGIPFAELFSASTPFYTVLENNI